MWISGPLRVQWNDQNAVKTQQRVTCRTITVEEMIFDMVNSFPFEVEDKEDVKDPHTVVDTGRF